MAQTCFDEYEQGSPFLGTPAYQGIQFFVADG